MWPGRSPLKGVKMKKLLLALAATLVLAFTTAIGASAQEQFAPVDVATIKSSTDYDAAKSAAWQRYSDRKAAAWTIYDAAKTAAWEHYKALEREALMKFRAADYPNYIQWLDAKEIGDYDLRFELEKTPAGAAYVETNSTEWKTYVMAEAVADGIYLVTEANANAVRIQEEALAEAAYKVADAAD